MKIIIPLIAFASIAAPLSSYACSTCGCSGSVKGHTHEKAEALGDIVDIATSAGSFDTLVAAVKAAGLVEVLKGDGPFTVFAPTDAAFAALPAGTVESLLEPANKDKLIAILTYHVVPAKVMAKDVKTMEAPTVNGATASVVVKDGKVTIEGANVVATDVKASNGVIHVIDQVIMPPM
ncbi:MAG: putative surface protein with fasciclin (FAS1) repeats [Candidatus Azotimanducaceae bacterium]|jgi:uncharacterized surface protein with fasciclin (FAS1) repeats